MNPSHKVNETSTMPRFQTASILLLVLGLGVFPAGVLLAETSLEASLIEEPLGSEVEALEAEAAPDGELEASELEEAVGEAPASAGETELAAPAAAAVPRPVCESAAAGERNALTPLVASLTIFVLAVFVGFEVITKVPPTLHTPLMSGSNAISGITLVGALVAAGAGHGHVWGTLLGTVAVALATVNVVGGFLVTHRMLQMFRKK